MARSRKRKKAKPDHVYLISAARKIWRWSKIRRDAIEAATVSKDWVECAECEKWLRKNPLKKKQRKDYAVDHIEPVVPPGSFSPQLPVITGTMTWDEWLTRLTEGALQVLCHPCHKKKTKAENDERKRKRPKLSALRKGTR